MDNCGISFGNDLKIIAKGDTIIIHYPLYIIHYPLAGATCQTNGNWQSLYKQHAPKKKSSSGRYLCQKAYFSFL